MDTRMISHQHRICSSSSRGNRQLPAIQAEARRDGVASGVSLESMKAAAGAPAEAPVRGTPAAPPSRDGFKGIHSRPFSRGPTALKIHPAVVSHRTLTSWPSTGVSEIVDHPPSRPPSCIHTSTRSRSRRRCAPSTSAPVHRRTARPAPAATLRHRRGWVRKSPLPAPSGSRPLPKLSVLSRREGRSSRTRWVAWPDRPPTPPR